MNKFVLTILFLATSSILLSSEKSEAHSVQFIGDPPSIKDKGDSDLFIGGTTPSLPGLSKVKEKIDLVQDVSHLLSNSLKIKEKDQNWLRADPAFLSSNKEINEDIDRFFKTFNGPRPISTPIAIDSMSQKVTPSSPLLNHSSSSTKIPAFSLEDRPIDFVKGGTSTAGAKQMVGSLISAYDSAMYQYLVGLETSSPLIASAVKQIQTWANQLNAMSIQSYDMATALMPGLSSKIQKANTFVCEQEYIAQGIDLLQAKTLCQNKTVREEAARDLAERNEQLFVGAFNIAEKILSQMGIVSNQDLLIKMTGTIISNGKGRIDHHPPKHREVLDELLSEKSGSKSQKMKILTLFREIQEKLRKDEEFTEEEKKLLNSSHFPVATLLTLMTQCQGTKSAMILERYSDLIAFERTLQFMEEMSAAILYKAESLRAVQIGGYELEAYIKQVRDVWEDLRVLKTENLLKIANEHKALDSFMQIDAELRQKARERS